MLDLFTSNEVAQTLQEVFAVMFLRWYVLHSFFFSMQASNGAISSDADSDSLHLPSQFITSFVD